MTIDELKKLYESRVAFSLSGHNWDYGMKLPVVYRFNGKDLEQIGMDGKWIKIGIFLDELLRSEIIK